MCRPGSSLRPSSALRYSQWTHPPYNLSHTGKRRDEILTFNETTTTITITTTATSTSHHHHHHHHSISLLASLPKYIGFFLIKLIHQTKVIYFDNTKIDSYIRKPVILFQVVCLRTYITGEYCMGWFKQVYVRILFQLYVLWNLMLMVLKAKLVVTTSLLYKI